MKSFDLSRFPPKWVVKKADDDRWQTVIDNSKENNWKGENAKFPYYGYTGGMSHNGINNYKEVPEGVKLLSLDEFTSLLSSSNQLINNNYEIF